MSDLPALPALAQSALQFAAYRSELLNLIERPAVALLRVHSLLDLPEHGHLFTNWPVRTGECLAQDPAVLCLRPREWLLLGEEVEPDELLKLVRRAADPATTAVYDKTDGLAVFRLDGPAAGWLLAKLCALDFPAGAADAFHCARTRMGHVAVILYFRGLARDSFDLIVDRSLARYLWELLIDSAPHAEQLASTGWPAAEKAPA